MNERINVNENNKWLWVLCSRSGVDGEWNVERVFTHPSDAKSVAQKWHSGDRPGSVLEWTERGFGTEPFEYRGYEPSSGFHTWRISSHPFDDLTIWEVDE